MFERKIVGARDAVDRAEHFAVEEEDALVALRHGGQVLLHHRERASFVGEELR